MDEQQAKILIQKYNDGIASFEEIKLLENWYIAQSAIEQQDPEGEDYLQVKAEMWETIKTQKDHVRTPYLWPRIVAAASILIFIGISLYFYQQSNKQAETAQVAQNDVAPGKNTATLTLASGRKIFLSDATKGLLAKEAGVKITKTANGQIVYEVQDNIGDENKTNILTTARGETYQIRLPDGTDVWLNAASSLKYPASFASASQRRVSLTGEAYFQVAKDKAHPFIVKTAHQEVQVLGTHFNVNSYADEATTKTTLLEGSVQVTGLHNEHKILKPGDQSVVTPNSIEIHDADIEEAVAWKNNEFMFGNDDFRTTMRKVARWYNIEVIYEDSAPVNLQLGGFSSRSRNISTVLKMMAKTGEVHFRVEGQKVYVSK